MNTIDKIKSLEILSRRLEPETEQRKHWRDAVAQYSDDFLDNIEDIKAYVVTEDKGRGIYDTTIGAPKSIETLLDVLSFNVDRPGLNPASGGHLAYIPGGGLFPSALGDYLADVFNRYAGMFLDLPVR
jgi:aromatic-L-amino-acid/L-tryptophan decarboxylase